MLDAYDTVRRYYDRDPQREWERFSRHRLEFPITLHFLNTCTRSGSTIPDVGGGPGRYAPELCRQGHIVDLFDLSSQSVELAKSAEEILDRSGKPSNASHWLEDRLQPRR